MLFFILQYLSVSFAITFIYVYVVLALKGSMLTWKTVTKIFCNEVFNTNLFVLLKI